MSMLQQLAFLSGMIMHLKNLKTYLQGSNLLLHTLYEGFKVKISIRRNTSWIIL